MDIKDAIGICFDKYISFNGRASRSEFWYFVLFYLICALVVAVMSAILDNLLCEYEYRKVLFINVMIVFQVVFCSPLISVSVRRLHDIGVNGKWNWLFFMQFPIFIDNMRTDYGWLIAHTQDTYKPLVFGLPFVILFIFVILFLVKGKQRYINMGQYLYIKKQ
ncbi:MAG: DUF805 domain-containing protein [Bacteroidales bacterium]|nr:DUF805 domain-containing protein [Bacteroidales bacterium]